MYSRRLWAHNTNWLFKWTLRHRWMNGSPFYQSHQSIHVVLFHLVTVGVTTIYMPQVMCLRSPDIHLRKIMYTYLKKIRDRSTSDILSQIGRLVLYTIHWALQSSKNICIQQVKGGIEELAFIICILFCEIILDNTAQTYVLLEKVVMDV